MIGRLAPIVAIALISAACGSGGDGAARPTPTTAPPVTAAPSDAGLAPEITVGSEPVDGESSPSTASAIPEGEPIDLDLPKIDGARCEVGVGSSAGEVAIVWSGLPPGGLLLVKDGAAYYDWPGAPSETVFSTWGSGTEGWAIVTRDPDDRRAVPCVVDPSLGPVEPTCQIAWDGGVVVTVDGHRGRPVVIRSSADLADEPIVAPDAPAPLRIVASAAEPGVVHRASVEVVGLDDRLPATSVECTGRALEPGSTPDDTLALALDTYRQANPYPYVWVRSRKLCLECQPVDSVASTDGEGAFTLPDGVDPAVNPQDLHQRLLAAIGDGQDVGYELGPSGLPLTWRIGDVAWEVLCVMGDTAPPEMGLGPCDPRFAQAGTEVEEPAG